MRFVLKVLPLILSVIALAISLYAILSSRASSLPYESDEFKRRLLTLVKACVDYNEEIKCKQEIHELINAIEDKSFFVQEGNDDLRIKFVNSQGCIEHVLACSQALGEIHDLVGVIHTPAPATPLCTKPDDSDMQNLLDESIRYDLDKLLTLRSRSRILREYMIKGGILYVVYPEGGLEKRNPEQRKIYLQELANYPQHLIDWKLSCKEMKPEYVGATYFFRNANNELFVFSLKGTQLNDPKQVFQWGIWFGLDQYLPVKERINTIFDYLKENNGPDLRPKTTF